MTKVGTVAMLVAPLAAMVVILFLSRSGEPLWLVAALMVVLGTLGVLLGIYVLDAAFRAAKAARDLARDDRQL